jgi:magnesium transporter
MKFELTKSYLTALTDAIRDQDAQFVLNEVATLHPADIAEIFDRITIEEARFIYRQLDEELASEVLVELDEDLKESFLSSLSNTEIAVQVEMMDSDDAADFIQTLPEERKDEILSQLEDVEHSSDIASLLSYDEDTAGGLMATEFIWANVNWTVAEALENLRVQAQEIENVYTIYTVDDHDRLLGTLSLKTFLYTDNSTKISEIYTPNPISVRVTTTDTEVAKLMEKYDLVVVPVIDQAGVLLGRITIDDVVDVMREEAEKASQIASGLSEKIEDNDSIWIISRARLPWLLVGLVGGICGSMVIGGFEVQLSKIPQLAFFIPMIAAMGGNVGVQSSALIVQGLANKSLNYDSTFSKILKELTVALFNGAILSFFIFSYNFLFGLELALCITVSAALFTVVIIAAIMGTLVPLLLNRYKIDPALATGPFITTMNDILGMLVYFTISYWIFL